MRRAASSLVACALIVAGCGGGGSGGNSGPASPEEIPDATDPPAEVLRIRPAIRQGLALFSTEESLRGNQSNVRINSDFSIGIETSSGLARQYRRPALETDGMLAYVTDDFSDILIMNKPGEGLFGVFDLEYTSFGIWVETNVPDFSEEQDARVTDAAAFLAVSATPATQMPRTGDAYYIGGAFAVETEDRAYRNLLNGDTEAVIDFASGALDYNIVFRDLDDVHWGKVQGRGFSISGNRFSKGVVTSDLGHKGGGSGRFGGPAAEEIVGTFAIKGPTTVNGSFGAQRLDLAD